MNSNSRTFKLFDHLNAFVIIAFVVTIPVSALAEPVKKAWGDSAVVQVKDSLRQIAEAATLWEKAGGCSNWSCTDIRGLTAAGKLSGAPQMPTGIGSNGTPLSYSATGRRMGGCGKNNSGAPTTINPALYNVSEQFCRDYNNSVGLGSTIVENCSSGGDCSASASTDPDDFPVVNSSTFCFRRSDTFAVIWMAPISAPPCL